MTPLIATEASLLSLAAVIFMFMVILWHAAMAFRHNRRNPDNRRQLFRRPLDLLMFSLFVAEALQGLGGALNMKWVKDGKTVQGHFCNAQGIIQNFGETAVALSNILISLYTLAYKWSWKTRAAKRLTLVAIIFIWVLDGVLVGIGNLSHLHKDPPFLGPSPYWCWINMNYLKWQIAGEYAWLWSALLLSFLVYPPVILWVREDSKNLRPALVLLVYPVVYFIVILPQSIVRWIGFTSRHSPPLAATFAAVSLFNLSGFFTVLLLRATKPNSGLFGKFDN